MALFEFCNQLAIRPIFTITSCFFLYKVKLADVATLTVKISDSRRHDELKEPFPVNTMYLPIKTKIKRKGVAKPLKELLPSNIDIKQFKDDLLSSFKEVTISKR